MFKAEKDDGVLKNTPEKFYVVVKSGREGKEKLKKSEWDSSDKCWKLDLALARNSAMEAMLIELRRKRWIRKKVVATGTLAIKDVEQASGSATQGGDRKGLLELKKNIFISGGDATNIKELALIFEIEPSLVGAPLMTDKMRAARWQQHVADKSEIIVSVLETIAGAHPAVKIAVDFMQVPLKMLKDKLDMDGKVVDLVNTMNELYGCATVKDDTLRNYDDFQVLFEAMIKQSINCFIFISKYDSESYPKHILEGAPEKINGFQKSLQHLKEQFNDEQLRLNTSTTLEVKSLVVALRESVEAVDLEVKLQGLKTVQLNPGPRCLPGTREATLTEIIERVFGGNKSFLWLSGLAGTGKSSIMASLSNRLDHLGCSSRLAAYVRFNRELNFHNPSEFVKALAYQLARFDPRLGEHIVDVVKCRPRIFLDELSDQLQSLVIQPLQYHRPRMLTEGPIVVLIDGLDECMEKVGGSDEFHQLLQLLSNPETFQSFPFLRFVVASRPEKPIHTEFTGAGRDHIRHIRLDTLLGCRLWPTYATILP
ncbi:hypothetical protein AAF712_009575 [Marasmius tenuissimus]|uniref:Nephrocystin 3-like N-terminal domain-containing protein n=1 Tax=Marasmius tenuissimus TaxID=585030 RepID=A0ABR2ZP93_9AGAR